MLSFVSFFTGGRSDGESWCTEKTDIFPLVDASAEQVKETPDVVTEKQQIQ